jgi:lipid II:glycine glycyltransferase (peptidoglycan interpeptide bridge formation enzyme)
MTAIIATLLLYCATNSVAVETKEEIKKNTSTFTRDPFWTVGYIPAPKSEQEQEQQITHMKSLIEWPKLKLRGITRTSDNKYMAVLDKIGIVEEGDIISVQKDGLIYRWKIDSINDRGISSKRLNVKATFKSLQKQ